MMFLENQQHIHANIIMSLRYLAQRELLSSLIHSTKTSLI